jgi:hypothetical protein
MLLPIAETIALRHKLPTGVVSALIWIESGNDPDAWNPEPKYRYFWDVQKNAPFRVLTLGEVASKVPPADFPCLAGDPDQEWWAQQASWGLMQVMGAVAREEGFHGKYLTALCRPTVNLECGCAHLAAQYKWADGNLEQTLAAYNGGRAGNNAAPYRNAAYAARVLKRMDLLNA